NATHCSNADRAALTGAILRSTRATANELATETAAPHQNAQKYGGSTGTVLSTSTGNPSSVVPTSGRHTCARNTSCMARNQAPSKTGVDVANDGFARRHQESIRTAPARVSHRIGRMMSREVTRSETNPGNRNNVRS